MATHIAGAGTLVLAQHQQQQQGVASTSTTAHPTITDAVTLRLVPRRKKKVRGGCLTHLPVLSLSSGSLFWVATGQQDRHAGSCSTWHLCPCIVCKLCGPCKAVCAYFAIPPISVHVMSGAWEIRSQDINSSTLELACSTRVCSIHILLHGMFRVCSTVIACPSHTAFSGCQMQSVKWAEDVAEINENSGKRKSKSKQGPPRCVPLIQL
jgi:hypothetical protein